ncbi:MAG TPA: zf-HC2 domain-containing protein [Acidobacteriota bacterium]|nr:zf-HC2 domain-containing protein [Acidobacteriota bacterium]
MSCEQCSERLMDVLYGEELNAKTCFQFFRHLDECGDCRAEYLELLKTREILADWKIEEDGSAVLHDREHFVKPGSNAGIGWFSVFHRIAAGILILLGAVSVLQMAGILPDRRVVVNERQLTEMVHDMILARQEQDWRIIGTALLEVKEELEARRRVEMQAAFEELSDLELRFVNALEENNRRVQTLLTGR